MLKQKNIFFPNLDGLRFFCFLSVFLFHGFYSSNPEITNSAAHLFIKTKLFVNGNLGVNFFFVLSGFLITYLLIEERSLQGKIDIPKFWLRRVLRIWPLYFFCVFFGFVIFPILKSYFGQTPNETAHPIYYLTFLNNFDFIKTGPPDASVLGVLWSIAIEEQFYFVWPLLLMVVPEKHYPKLFLLILVISWTFRAVNHNYILNEYHTLSCMGDLTIGALGAYFCRIERWKLKIENWSKGFILLIYFSFFIVFFFRRQIFFQHPIIEIFERSFIAIIILFIILEQNFAKYSFFKLSRLTVISKLGTISYGLYCLHFIGILITINLSRKLHLNTSLWSIVLIETPMALLLTILISKFSYAYVERPFLRLKEKFAYIIK